MPTSALAITPGQSQHRVPRDPQPIPTTAPASQPESPDTQCTQGTAIHKTIPSSLGEVAALPNSQKQAQKVKQNGEM